MRPLPHNLEMHRWTTERGEAKVPVSDENVFVLPQRLVQRVRRLFEPSCRDCDTHGQMNLVLLRRCCRCGQFNGKFGEE